MLRVVPRRCIAHEGNPSSTLRNFKWDNNLHYIESRLNVGEEQAISSIAKTQKYVADKYPHVPIAIFDSPPGTSCPVLEATKDADYVILVAEPTPFGLHDLKLAVETMRELKRDYGVVINRYGIGDNKVIEYCTTEGIEILAKIPNSRQIAELYSKGNLIYKEVPEVEAALSNILTHCIAKKEGVNR